MRYLSSRRMRYPAGVLILGGVLAGSAGCATAISTEQEAQLGAQAAADINRQLPIVGDQQVNYYINQLGNQIARRVDQRGLQYQFHVVNSNVVNAFAVPGGHIYVNRGLIQRADNVSELAGVLAHEIGHVVERHGIEQMQKMQNAQLGLALGQILLGAPSQAVAAGINIGGTYYFAQHSQKAELEADRVAVQYLVQAGINPQGVVTFFQELLNERQRQPSALDQWFSTHPLTEDRIRQAQAMVNQIPASQRQGLTTDSQNFRSFRARVGQLPAPPRGQ